MFLLVCFAVIISVTYIYQKNVSAEERNKCLERGHSTFGVRQWCSGWYLTFLLFLSFHLLIVFCASVVDANFIGRSNARRQHLHLGFLQNWMVSYDTLLYYMAFCLLFTPLVHTLKYNIIPISNFVMRNKPIVINNLTLPIYFVTSYKIFFRILICSLR